MKFKKIELISLTGLIFLFIIAIVNTQEYNSSSTPIEILTLSDISTSTSDLYEWNRTWGGALSDYGEAVSVDSSDNIYLAGYTANFGAGDTDMVLVKYDSYGVQLWNRTWGGILYDRGDGVAVDSFDNVYLGGYTANFGAGDTDMVLVKYDSYGVQLWNRTWGGPNEERIFKITIDSQDNIYLAGRTFSFGAGDEDLVLVKFNSSGIQQWNRTWGGISADYGGGVAVDSSDNVYLVGHTYSFGVGAADTVLVKYSSSGVQYWNRTWGGSSNDNGWDVAVDSYDNVYLAGGTISFEAVGYDFLLIKYNSNGLKLWNHTWGGPEQYSIESCLGVVVDSSDNVYLTGQTYSWVAGDHDIALVKFDSSGKLSSYHIWGGADEEWGFKVAVDSSDNIYLAGHTFSFGAGDADMVLIKYRPDIKPLEIPGFYFFPFISLVLVLTVVYLNRKKSKSITGLKCN